MMRPFALSDGAITRDWYKALVLQLESDDDDAANVARTAVERRAERMLKKGLEEWLREVLPPSTTEAEIATWAERLRTGQAKFRDVLQRVLMDSVDLGTAISFDQLGTVGLAFDYTLANERARDWARTYIDDLLPQLYEVTERGVGESIARWTESGEPLNILIKDLEESHLFSRQRARNIAITEVTRAYAESAQIGYLESGLITHVQWVTANDERVCPICAPLGGLQFSDTGAIPASIEQQDQGGIRTEVGGQFTHPGGAGAAATYTGQLFRIPAHVNCRCDLVPVIEEQ